MQNFTDDTGRQWTVRVTVDVCRKVANATGYKLLELVNGEALNRFIFDAPAITQAAYLASKTDGEKPTLEQFENAISGDTIEKIRDVFLEALKDFFPQSHRSVLTGYLAIFRQSILVAREKLAEAENLLAQKA
jgi:hypothetical protein